MLLYFFRVVVIWIIFTHIIWYVDDLDAQAVCALLVQKLLIRSEVLLLEGKAALGEWLVADVTLAHFLGPACL